MRSHSTQLRSHESGIIFLHVNSFCWAFPSRQDSLKVDGCKSNSHVMLNQLLFYKFYDFFCRLHSLMNRPCYNDLFQFMQHGNFRNLNRVIFTRWKHLDFRVNVFSAVKRHTFHYLTWNQLPSPATRALSKYCNCLIHGVIKV